MTDDNKSVNGDIKEMMRKHVKDWIAIDTDTAPLILIIDQKLNNINNDRRILLAQKKKLLDSKRDATDQIINIMKTNEIDRINASGGTSLNYKKKVTKKSISKKFLVNTIKTYFDDVTEANTLTEYILNNRDETVIESLKIIK